ncbi:hypothetical protein ABFS83_10G099600 [Erythranthe nasuta]
MFFLIIFRTSYSLSSLSYELPFALVSSSYFFYYIGGDEMRCCGFWPQSFLMFHPIMFLILYKLSFLFYEFSFGFTVCTCSTICLRNLTPSSCVSFGDSSC